MISTEMRIAKDAHIDIQNRDWIEVEMILKTINDDIAKSSNSGTDIMAGIQQMMQNHKPPKEQ